MDVYEFFTLVQTILALKNEGGTTNEDLEAQLLSSLQQGSDIKKRLDKLHQDVFKHCKTDKDVLHVLNQMRQLLLHDTKELEKLQEILQQNMLVSSNVNSEVVQTNKTVKQILNVLHEKFEVQRTVDEIANNVEVLVSKNKAVAHEIYVNFESKSSYLKRELQSLCQGIIHEAAFVFLGSPSEIDNTFFDDFPLEKALIYYPYFKPVKGQISLNVITLTSAESALHINKFLSTIWSTKVKLNEMVADSPPASILRDKIRAILARPLFNTDIDEKLFTKFPDDERAEQVAKQLAFFIRCVEEDLDALATMLFLLKKKNQYLN